MQKITMFYLTDCPYCKNARKAMEELKGENPEYRKLDIEMIEEEEHADIADQWDYWAVPSMFVGKEKVFEAHIGQQYPEIREHVKEVFDKALAE